MLLDEVMMAELDDEGFREDTELVDDEGLLEELLEEGLLEILVVVVVVICIAGLLEDGEMLEDDETFEELLEELLDVAVIDAVTAVDVELLDGEALLTTEPLDVDDAGLDVKKLLE